MPPPLKSYRELLVWQKGIELVVDVYKASALFPKSETYGLSSQIRRAATSIPANIAEGYGRGSRKEYLQFLLIAQGSLKELETHIIISEKLIYLTPSQARLLSETDELGRMLGSLIQKLKSSSPGATPNTLRPTP